MLNRFNIKFRRALAIYKIKGFFGFLGFFFSYIYREISGFLGSKITVFRYIFHEFFSNSRENNQKLAEFSGRLKVLYVDQISDKQSKAIVNGIAKAYGKISSLEIFDYTDLFKKYGEFGVNGMLVKRALNLKPDLIHIGKCEKIRGITIKKIKDKINTCVIHFYGDFRWDVQHWVADIGKYADWLLLYHKDQALIQRYKDAGAKNIGFWWPGADSEIFFPRDSQKKYDVVFMGNNADFLRDHKTRRELLEAIADNGFKLDIFGNGWEYLYDRLHIHLHPFVDENEFATVCSGAKISIGINAVNNVRFVISWRRVFNSMASGAFHLTYYVPGLREVFDNKKHLVWYNSIPEAINLIDYYLKHDEEREKIAEAGRKEVLARHTWDNRIAEIFNFYNNTKRGSKNI